MPLSTMFGELLRGMATVPAGNLTVKMSKENCKQKEEEREKKISEKLKKSEKQGPAFNTHGRQRNKEGNGWPNKNEVYAAARLQRGAYLGSEHPCAKKDTVKVKPAGHLSCPHCAERGE